MTRHLCYLCAGHTHTGIVNALLAKDGIDINKTTADGFTPLHIACLNGNTGIVNALLAKNGIDINKTSADGSTPLHIACQNGHTDIVNALLTKDGIDINKTSADGFTPLFIACVNDHTEAVNALLSKDGIDINKSTAGGYTLLHIACYKGHTDIVNSLLAKDGIDTNKTAADGDTPLHIACQQNHPAIVELLLMKALSGLKLSIDTQGHRTELHASLMTLHTELHNEISLNSHLPPKGQLKIKLRTKAVIDSVNMMIQGINAGIGHEEKLNAINNCRSELYPLRIAKNIAKALLSVCIVATAAVFFLAIVPVGAAPAAAIALGTAALTSYGLFRRSPLDTAINRCLNAATTDLTEPPHPANQAIPAF